MDNDLGINTITTSTKYKLRLDSGIVLQWQVSQRLGSNVDMAHETVRHWLKAAMVLAEGGRDVEDDTYCERSAYSDKLFHGESRVVVFGDMPLALPGGITWQQVNVCNEFTTAQEIVHSVWQDFEAQTAITGWHPHIEVVGKTKYTAAATTNAPASAQTVVHTDHAATPPEVVNIGDYNYKQRAEYEQQYVGRTVAINVSQVARRMEAKKDGSGVYECLRVYGYYNDMPSENPIYDFTMYPPKEGQQWGDWQTFFKHIQTGEINEVGKAITTPMRLYYKLSTGKGDNGGRVFWNLRKVVFFNIGLSANGGHSVADDADADALHPEDEIPF